MPAAGRVTAAVAAVVAFAICVAACGGTNANTGAAERPAVGVEETQTLFVIGSGATVGIGLDLALQDAWPRILHREAFPRATVLVNAALEEASAADALEHQVPLAEELSPAVVAIWLGAIEAFGLSPVDEFAANLDALVERVRATGARVLIADLPENTAVPIEAFNDAIARVAEEHDATLVSLRSSRITTARGAGPAFLPDVAGHRVIADAFADALR